MKKSPSSSGSVEDEVPPVVLELSASAPWPMGAFKKLLSLGYLLWMVKVCGPEQYKLYPAHGKIFLMSCGWVLITGWALWPSRGEYITVRVTKDADGFHVDGAPKSHHVTEAALNAHPWDELRVAPVDRFRDDPKSQYVSLTLVGGAEELLLEEMPRELWDYSRENTKAFAESCGMQFVERATPE